MKTYIFFDTETNGLPKNYKAPASDTANWPKILQLAFMAFDENGKELLQKEYIIKWPELEIDKKAAEIHGITHERMMSGVDFDDAFIELRDLVWRAESPVLIAHNLAFDSKVLSAQMIESGLEFLKPMLSFCTMRASTNILKIEGPYGFKWPKLQELHKWLFDFEFEGAHDALADVKATAKCFFELKKRGLIHI